MEGWSSETEKRKEFLVRTFITTACAATNSQASRLHQTDRPYPHPPHLAPPPHLRRPQSRTARESAALSRRRRSLPLPSLLPPFCAAGKAPGSVCARGAFSASADALALLTASENGIGDSDDDGNVPVRTSQPDPVGAPDRPVITATGAAAAARIAVVSRCPSPASHATRSTRLRSRRLLDRCRSLTAIVMVRALIAREARQGSCYRAAPACAWVKFLAQGG